MTDKEIMWQPPTQAADEAFRGMSENEQCAFLGFAPDDYLLSTEDFDKKMQVILEQKNGKLDPVLLQCAISNHSTERFNFRMTCACVDIDTECNKLSRNGRPLTMEELDRAMQKSEEVWQHESITKDKLVAILRDAIENDSRAGKRKPDDQIRRNVFKKQIKAIINNEFYIRTPEEKKVFFESSEKPRSWIGCIKDYIKKVYDSVFNKNDSKMRPISSSSVSADAINPKQQDESKGLKH